MATTNLSRGQKRGDKSSPLLFGLIFNALSADEAFAYLGVPAELAISTGAPAGEGRPFVQNALCGDGVSFLIVKTSDD